MKQQRKEQAKQQQNARQKNPNKSPKKKNQPRHNAIPSDRNRFDAKGPSTSLASNLSSLSKIVDETPTTDPTTTRQKSAQKLKREMLEKLFKEKPELFEKRIIIIDGSNLARSYVVVNFTSTILDFIFSFFSGLLYCRHGIRNQSYSIKGIELGIRHFESLGFSVRAVVPQMR